MQPTYDRMQAGLHRDCYRLHASVLFQKMWSYFTQRMNMRVLGVKYDCTFLRRPISWSFYCLKMHKLFVMLFLEMRSHAGCITPKCAISIFSYFFLSIKYYKQTHHHRPHSLKTLHILWLHLPLYSSSLNAKHHNTLSKHLELSS